MIYCLHEICKEADGVKTRKAYAGYIASLLLFGSNGILAGQIALPSAEIVFWRTLTGSLLLIGMYGFQNRKRLLTAAAAVTVSKDLLFVALSGISMGLSWIFLYDAYARIGVSLASLAYYCGPVIVMVLSPVLFHEKLTPGGVAGFLIVLLGVVLTNGTAGGNIERIGLLSGFASAAAHALMVIFSKKAPHIKGLENSIIQLVCSFLTVAVFIGAQNGWALRVECADWGWLLVLGLVNTGFGCFLYFSSLGALSVQTVSVLGYLEPLSAVLLAVLLLGEHMTGAQWCGAGLILGGALFGELCKARQHPSGETGG